MYMLLLLVGVLVSAAGFVTIGFGIPINAFSLGNTLIIAGATSVSGGFVLIGLSMVLRQLGRVAELLRDRPAGVVRAARPAVAETGETLVPPTARIAPAPAPSPVPTRPAAPPRSSDVVRPAEPAMSRPMESRAMESRPQEPRLPVEPRFPAAASEGPGPLDWMRAKPKSPYAPEPPVVEVADEAPLSPRTPQRPLFSPPPMFPAGNTEPSFESKAWSPGHDGEQGLAPISRSEQIARANPVADRPRDAEFARDMVKEDTKESAKESGLFDVVWPDVRARAVPPMSEPAVREPKADAAPHDTVVEKRADENRSETPVAVLKSGVIDGMGYTLYADGSIEAELPQGTVKFASVDALRAHLEKSA